MILTLLASFGIGALIGFFTVVALKVVSWIIRKIVGLIAGLIRKIGEKIATFRKKKARKRIIENLLREAGKVASQDDRAAIIAALNDLNNDDSKAIMNPLNEKGEEDWTKVQIVQAESQEDDMDDFTIITAEERVRTVAIK